MVSVRGGESERAGVLTCKITTSKELKTGKLKEKKTRVPRAAAYRDSPRGHAGRGSGVVSELFIISMQKLCTSDGELARRERDLFVLGG
jgi:hypothetical protein